MKIYGDLYSGNCYKLKLICALLGIEHEWIPVDIMRGETREDHFLALNPVGQIPICVTDDGQTLTESNAILYYLSQGSDLWPTDRLAQTRVLEWQFFEQYSHEPFIAVVRFWHFSGQLEQNRSLVPEKMERGYQALQVMEAHLSSQPYFAGDEYSIADIALYAYTHVATEGSFELDRFAAVNRWLERVRQQDGHVLITDNVGAETGFPD